MPRTVATKVITVPGNLAQACHEFNSGLFFDTHESLEEIWQEEQGELRDLYKGLIQVAAAFVHVTRGNFRGADRLFTTGVAYLAPYRDRPALGFEVDAFCAAVQRFHQALTTTGENDVLYDPGAIPLLVCDLDQLPAEARRWRAWGFDRDGNALPMEIPDLG